jgi:hypothetical protein
MNVTERGDAGEEAVAAPAVEGGRESNAALSKAKSAASAVVTFFARHMMDLLVILSARVYIL